ncbi:conserved hypothetical protein [Pyrobaculum islandicum DSM 4184]|uniref:Flavin reductase like domain-containing protein n=1 Tax=Pyrobaculum islandicum (strain DSM 4184 / JCM 9189 / GEO3) TaxID=384616 RepID=A1RT42_PYRIL|nr:flavin reductase [Pyrobaculum islandicum]ABL88124.1 conserved hypothetical protein [Pyrobaculum islandicum DSM 4184]
MCEKAPLPTPILIIVVENHGAVVGWPLVIPGETTLIALPFYKDRKTLALIRQKKAFSINLVNDAQRAVEIFGKPGEKKLEKWGNVVNCKVAPCYALGDASRVIECIYRGEFGIKDHVVVLCSAVASYGCGKFTMWDPCANLQLPAV